MVEKCEAGVRGCVVEYDSPSGFVSRIQWQSEKAEESLLNHMGGPLELYLLPL